MLNEKIYKNMTNQMSKCVIKCPLWEETLYPPKYNFFQWLNETYLYLIKNSVAISSQAIF